MFPLQSLEEIMTDPRKFNHTRKITKEELAKRRIPIKLTKTQRMATGLLGSKYSFQKSSVTLYDVEQGRKRLL